jgi:hypothetical protein
MQVKAGFTTVTATDNVALDTHKNSINKVFNGDDGALKVYDGSASFNFALSNLEKSKAYLLNLKAPLDIAVSIECSGAVAGNTYVESGYIENGYFQ